MEKLLKILAFLPAVAAAQETPNGVWLQHACADTKYTFEQLDKKYGESPILRSIMPDNENMVISVWHNKDARTITIIQTSLNQNLSCVLGIGEDARLIYKFD
jgi:hypothetical protein